VRKALIGLVILIVVESFLGTLLFIRYLDLLSSNEQTKKEFYGLQNLYNELDMNYYSLNSSYVSLTERYTSLEGTYESLMQNHSSLVAAHRELERSYASLMENCSILVGKLQMEQMFGIGNSLQSYYDVVRQEKGLDGTKGSWNPDQDQVRFAAKLASHDLGNPYLPAIESEFEEIVGERSYEIAKKRIDEIITLIGVAEDDSAVEKIRKILNFTNLYIHYEYEINNVYRAPVETLGLRSGDCDDYTILVAAVFEAVAIDSAIGSFKNVKEDYHYMVLVHLEDLSGYAYRLFPDLTGLGLERGKWILIEPQYLIEHQGDEWLEQWYLLAAAPVEK